MLTPQKVLNLYYLEARCMLVELAATLDRYDCAVDENGDDVDPADKRLSELYASLAVLADRDGGPDRARRLLELFSDPT